MVPAATLCEVTSTGRRRGNSVLWRPRASVAHSTMCRLQFSPHVSPSPLCPRHRDAILYCDSSSRPLLSLAFQGLGSMQKYTRSCRSSPPPDIISVFHRSLRLSRYIKSHDIEENSIKVPLGMNTATIIGHNRPKRTSLQRPATNIHVPTSSSE